MKGVGEIIINSKETSHAMKKKKSNQSILRGLALKSISLNNVNTILPIKIQ